LILPAAPPILRPVGDLAGEDLPEQGPFAHNLRLSQERAEEVRAALLGSGAGLSPHLIVAKGYGELMPVACNADEASREKNRRVEAWLVAS
jgi:outer membrane protein OmpA-like peptidoglycan-associated protein